MYRDLIIQEAKKQGINSIPQLAYILATAYWETNKTYEPIKEAYWLSENWRKKNLRYYPYYGRGFVQLTWLSNYKKYSDLLGVDLVNYPDNALNPELAAYILVHGMINGTFTGKKLKDYINADKKDYFSARKIINGTDRAQDIATIAGNMEEWLRGMDILGKSNKSFTKELQSLINEYSDANLVIDGVWGPKSKAALRKLIKDV